MQDNSFALILAFTAENDTNADNDWLESAKQLQILRPEAIGEDGN
jgi:hypothetical protein